MIKENENQAVIAIISQIKELLAQYLINGEKQTIFINKMGLTEKEREELNEYLGTGTIKIKLEHEIEPAEWIETNHSGIWHGVYYGHNKRPVLETLEICDFPKVAGAFREDMEQSVKGLEKIITYSTL